MKAIQQEGEFKAGEMIDSFRRYLSQGHLFIPGFVNTLNSGDTVNMQTLKPETGGLSKEAFVRFKKGEVVRTNDPFHSFFIWGKNAETIAEDTFDNRDTFGTGSVFGYLHKQGATLLIVDLELYYGFTFAHYVEQQKKVSYRKDQTYTFDFIDMKGNRSETSFRIYAKKKGYNPVLNSLHKPFMESGTMQTFSVNGIPVMKINLQKAYTVLENDILHNNARNLINFSLPLYLKQTAKKITR